MAISDLSFVPTGYERLLPPNAQMTVHALRKKVAARVGGRVLDLGGSESHRVMHRSADISHLEVLDGPDDPRVAELVAEKATFDHLISVCAMVRVRDLDGLLADLRTLLADDGRLQFVEPVPHPGRLRTVTRLTAPVIAMTSGMRLERDVVPAIRRADLTICDIRRNRVAALRWPVQHVAWGSARPTRAGRSGGHTPEDV